MGKKIVVAGAGHGGLVAGMKLAAAGYDWTAQDLEDLTLQVDISLTSVKLSTDLWTSTEDIELWI